MGRARVGCRDPPQVRPCRLVCCHPWQHTVPPTHPCPPFDRGLVGNGKSKAESRKQKAESGKQPSWRCAARFSSLIAHRSPLTAHRSALSTQRSTSAPAPAAAPAPAPVPMPLPVPVPMRLAEKQCDDRRACRGSSPSRGICVCFLIGDRPIVEGRGCVGWRDHERHGWRDMSLHGWIHGVSREPTHPRPACRI